MKKSILLGLMLVFASLTNAQTADAILGKWQSAHGSGQIEIVKRGDLYFGKLIWMKEPNDASGKPKLDIHNPSEELKSQPILGHEILKNFSYSGNNVWGNGNIYNPKNGKTYDAQMNMVDKDKLNIRGYFGISLIGKTETWTRVK